jgi:hypothetical protein
MAPLYTCVCGLFAPSPRSSADRAEDFRVSDYAPTSHRLQGNWGVELVRAIVMQLSFLEMSVGIGKIFSLLLELLQAVERGAELPLGSGS